MIDGNLRARHVEVNEDGEQSLHPGYTEVKCQRCGKYFMVAVTSSANFCGDPRCGREPDKELV